MFGIFRVIARAVFLIASLPFRLVNLVVGGLFLNIRWRWVTYSINAVLLFGVAALALAYPVAFAIGWLDPGNFKPVFTYADQRARGTAIFDSSDRFVGIIDPHLDSVYDLNLSENPVVTPSYIAYPDHKSLHVDEAPPAFWACLKYHEDRYLGTWRNMFGIDLVGLVRMPYSTIERSIASRRLRFGAGGSTLSMQLVRSFLKQLPSSNETMLDKVTRKMREWWLAPILHNLLTQGDGDKEFARWAANHLPIAQRVGGSGIFGVELASWVIFDMSSADLTAAQQYVLAAAVNRPIEVLPHDDPAHERQRLKRWKRLVAGRAMTCAKAGITSAILRDEVVAELEALSQTAPRPRMDADVVLALEDQPNAPTGRSVNPVRRANNLLGALQYGLRQELVERHGYAWRNHVGAVHLTFNALDNQSFARRIDGELETLINSSTYARKNAALSFDISKAATPGAIVPRIVIAAANGDGELVRYYENYATAVYYGSQSAWDAKTGLYDPASETMQLASVGKIIAAIALGNEGRDTAATLYRDACVSGYGAESCRRSCAAPHRTVRHRPVRTIFACSLSRPLIDRLTRFREDTLFGLVDELGASTRNLGTTPIETAIANGLVSASPRTLHQIQLAMMDAMDDTARAAVAPPSLIRTADVYADDANEARKAVPVIKPDAIAGTAGQFIRTVLTEPVCHPNGTLRRLRGQWCSRSNGSISLHLAKTGTRSFRLPAGQPDTMDLWVSGQIHFNSGQKYTYVVYMGTGDPRKLMGRFAAGRQAGPLLRVLLEDLARDAAGS
jgi:hypothetical protein